MPLQWEKAGDVVCHDIAGIVNRSIQGNANVFYSIQVIRSPKNGKPGKYIRIEDLDSLAELADKIRQFIQVDTEAVRNAKNVA